MATVLEAVKIELLLALSTFKKIDTWMYIVTVVVILSALYRSWGVAIASFIILFLLSVKRHYDAGTITNYIREQQRMKAGKDYATIKDLVEDE